MHHVIMTWLWLNDYASCHYDLLFNWAVVFCLFFLTQPLKIPEIEVSLGRLEYMNVFMSVIYAAVCKSVKPYITVSKEKKSNPVKPLVILCLIYV